MVGQRDNEGPEVLSVHVEEYQGDGDGIIGADEDSRIVVTLGDASGVGSIQLQLDGAAIGEIEGPTQSGPNCWIYQAIIGPLDAGLHELQLEATDTSPSMNGSSEYQSLFSVVSAEEITLLQDDQDITDGANNTIDFGTVAVGSQQAIKHFTVRNEGEQALTLDQLSLPAGFTLFGPTDGEVRPGGRELFTIILDTDLAGVFAGQVELINSDGPRSPDGIDENAFDFSVRGEVINVPGEIRGNTWDDRNGNGLREQDESGREGWMVYADINKNGVFDPGEPSDISDADGNFVLTGLQPDTYSIGQVSRDLWTQTYPTQSRQELSLHTFIPGLEARPGYHTVRGIAFSPDEQLIYVSHWQAGLGASNDPIAVYSTSDYSLVDQIDGGQAVGNVVVSLDGRYVYAPEYYGGYIHRYDTWADNAVTSIRLGTLAHNVWMAPSGDRILVEYDSTGNSADSLALIDISGDSFALLDTQNIGRPIKSLSAAFSADGDHIYLVTSGTPTSAPALLDLNVSDTLSIVRELDLSDGQVQDLRMVGVARSEGSIYVANQTYQSLLIIDEDSFAIGGQLSLADAPTNIIVHPSGNSLLVLYGGSGSVSMIDLATLSETGSLPGLNAGIIDAEFSADGTKIFLTHFEVAQGGMSVVDVAYENESGFHEVILDSGDVIEGVDFGNQSQVLDQPS